MLMPILHADSACIMGLAVSLFWVSTYHEDVEKSVESRMDCWNGIWTWSSYTIL